MDDLHKAVLALAHGLQVVRDVLCEVIDRKDARINMITANADAAEKILRAISKPAKCPDEIPVSQSYGEKSPWIGLLHQDEVEPDPNFARGMMHEIAILREKCNAAVATEQNCRAINNRLIAENAALRQSVAGAWRLLHKAGVYGLAIDEQIPWMRDNFDNKPEDLITSIQP